MDLNEIQIFINFVVLRGKIIPEPELFEVNFVKNTFPNQ
jgi:hypothetical protein